MHETGRAATRRAAHCTEGLLLATIANFPQREPRHTHTSPGSLQVTRQQGPVPNVIATRPLCYKPSPDWDGMCADAEDSSCAAGILTAGSVFSLGPHRVSSESGTL